MFFYNWADCTLLSDFELPELIRPAAPASPDVVVRMVPFVAEDGVPPPEVVWTGADHFSMVTSVARYTVRGGREILVQPFPGSEMEGVRLFLLGSAFAALAVQRGLIQLHCSAIAGDAGALAFAGNSGDGKSTLLAHLAARGHRVLSDDTLPLQVRPGQPPLALAAVRRLKLLPDSLAALGMNPADYPPILPGEAKRSVAAVEAASVPAPPVPLAALYLLERGEPGCRAQIRPVTGAAALAAIRANIFRPGYAVQAGSSSSHRSFQAALAVAAAVSVFRLIRSWDLSRIGESLDLIEQHRPAARRQGKPEMELWDAG